MALVLFDYELDPEAYKVRLLLAILGVPYAKRPVDMFPGQENLTPAFLALSPRGRLPVLEADGLLLSEAEGILAFLARTFDAACTWLPKDGAQLAETLRWLVFSAVDLDAARRARYGALFGEPAAIEKDLEQARRALEIMEDHMTARFAAGAQWFATRDPTIADLALFPGFALSRDFGVDHGEYPALRRWLRRVRDIPGFVPMPGVPGYH